MKIPISLMVASLMSASALASGRRMMMDYDSSSMTNGGYGGGYGGQQAQAYVGPKPPYETKRGYAAPTAPYGESKSSSYQTKSRKLHQITSFFNLTKNKFK